MKRFSLISGFLFWTGTAAILAACSSSGQLGTNQESVGGSGGSNGTGSSGVGGSNSGDAGAGISIAGTNAGVAGNSSGTAGAESGGAPGACSDLPGAALIASTPRDNVGLEQLALKFSDGPIADQATYDRLVQDVIGIYSVSPSLSDITYFPPDDGRTLLLSVDAATLSSMQGGGYHAWDCLNDAYVTTAISYNAGSLPSVQVQLKGIYNLRKLATDYAQLAGVSAATAADGGGDGSTICVTQDKDIWHYVFDRASGDCAAGCTEHEYHHFSTTAVGAITDLGVPTEAEVTTFASEAACR